MRSVTVGFVTQTTGSVSRLMVMCALGLSLDVNAELDSLTALFDVAYRKVVNEIRPNGEARIDIPVCENCGRQCKSAYSLA